MRYCLILLNPFMTNGLAHHNHLGESMFILRGVRSNFDFLFHFSMKFLKANRITPDEMPHSAASHLGLHCLHKCPIYTMPGFTELSISCFSDIELQNRRRITELSVFLINSTA